MGRSLPVVGDSFANARPDRSRLRDHLMFCSGCRCVLALALTLLLVAPASAQKVPAGFKAELLYSAPEIEHPSVVTCDDRGNLFVGEDPMDMRGPTTKEFDRVLYIQFDEAGKPVKKTVFCEGLAAVFGLVWLDGSLYVMHAPHYSVFRDTDGDGVADERRDLADGFGPPAGIHGFNDHIVTGTRLGLDGLIYVSVGDKGIQRATGADGSQITLEGGGVVRMRPDGTRLEVVSSGTRNHLDVAMDSLDNIFTYDNTDDGLGWWTRFTHHIPTGYYGYPYDYHPHPERHLPRISEHGGGSPVGAACYREAAWPTRLHDAAFHCEWGKGKIQVFLPRRQGATFEADMEDFMTAEPGSEFRPQDLCFSPDGRYMYVADWNFGGWTKPDVVGRLYRVSYFGGDIPAESLRVDNLAPLAAQIEALSHPAHSERLRAQHELARRGPESIPALSAVLSSTAGKFAKVHAIWALSAISGKEESHNLTQLLAPALKDTEPDVRAQAARALGLARRADAVQPLLTLLKDSDPSVRMWASIGLGRIGDSQAVEPLFAALAEPDQFARFAMIQALRAINHWGSAPKHLGSDDQQVASGALLTLTTIYDDAAVQSLAGVARAQNSLAPQAIAALAEVGRKADPYKEGWWGTQPARNKPARPKIHDWSGTPLVLSAIREGLDHAQPAARVAAIVAVESLADRDSLPKIRERIADPDPDVARAAMAAVAALKDDGAVPALIALAGDAARPDELRQSAVKSLTAIGSPATIDKLTALLSDSGASPSLLTLALGALAELKADAALAAIQELVRHDSADVRAQSITSLVTIAGASVAPQIAEHLNDGAPVVRRSTLRALAQTKSAEYLDRVLEVAADTELRRDAIACAAAMPHRRALPLYLEGLVDKNAELRDACRSAVQSLTNELADDLRELDGRGELSGPVKLALQQLVAEPAPIREWQVAGAFQKSARPPFDPNSAPDTSQPVELEGKKRHWRKVASSEDRGRVRLDSMLRPRDNAWALAYAPLESPRAIGARLTVGSDDQLVVWLNGQQIYEHQDSRSWNPVQATIDVQLVPGTNHLWVLAGNDSGPWDFSVALARPSEQFAFLAEGTGPALDAAAYREFALTTSGDPARGRKLFEDRSGVACVKCHAVSGQGGQVGPDLASIGAKYPREELIRSVLEPSNRILSGYQLSIVVTTDGEVLQGIIKNDAADAVEIVDAEGRSRAVAKSDIDQREEGSVSMMPVGLKDGLSREEFADVIAYLESLKDAPPAASAGQ